MKIPEKVVISGVPFDVMMINANVANLNNQYVGVLNECDQLICIKECASEMQYINFLHECVHGMLFGIGILGDHDEKLVDGLAHQLYLFIRDNPDVFKD